MNKKTVLIVSLLVGVLLIGGGVFAYTSNQNDKSEKEKMAMEKESENAAMKAKEIEAMAMEKEKMAKEASMTPEEKMAMEKDGTAHTDDAMKKEAAMAKSGSYVTLADYNKDTSKYADTKTVYFFHASWCPICQGIDKEITADMSKIPAGVTVVKTDFDSSTDLRKKYGVTYQYTFVQVDNNGNETAQWSATSLANAIAGIKS